MKDISAFFDQYETFPNVLVVGCGEIGTALVKALIDNIPHNFCNIYVTDSDKERARKLSEYRISMITPIRWRDAHDTPDDVDVIVVAVNSDIEFKLIERIADSKLPFVSLCDDADVYEQYLDNKELFIENKIHGVIGTGIVPGMSNVLVKYLAGEFVRVNDIVVDRLGFASKSNLNSIKTARRQSPLCVRDGMISDSKHDAGTLLSWFISPYNLVECQSVSTGVLSLYEDHPDVYNITVRYGEPRLPTFGERIKNVSLRIPLPVSNALLRVEVHGLTRDGFETKILCLNADVKSSVIATTISCIYNLFISGTENSAPFISVGELLNPSDHLSLLMSCCADLYVFDGINT